MPTTAIRTYSALLVLVRSSEKPFGDGIHAERCLPVALERVGRPVLRAASLRRSPGASVASRASTCSSVRPGFGRPMILQIPVAPTVERIGVHRSRRLRRRAARRPATCCRRRCRRTRDRSRRRSENGCPSRRDALSDALWHRRRTRSARSASPITTTARAAARVVSAAKSAPARRADAERGEEAAAHPVGVDATRFAAVVRLKFASP